MKNVQKTPRRQLVVTAIAALALVALPAHADRGYQRGHGHHGGGGAPWAGLAVVGAIAGLAIMAERRPAYVAPYYAQPPVYSAPVQYSAPPVYYEPERPAANMWYYCQSSAMYFPYTKACPEGWEAVPARPY